MMAARFVVSHPFARKKAKGWGTEFVEAEIALSHPGGIKRR